LCRSLYQIPPPRQDQGNRFKILSPHPPHPLLPQGEGVKSKTLGF
jgi:hypothetical protein